MSTVEVVHRHVLGALMRGELAPGTWLRQDDLAAELGVSKIPVREALQRLAAEGLVTFEANRGSVVRALTATDAEEIYTMRLALEPLLLRRSIVGLTIVHLAEAELALDDPSASIGEANWRFHHALYAAAGWERMDTTVARLHAAVAPYVVLYTEGLRGSPVSDGQHRELLAYCRANDVEGAVAILTAHLVDASSTLVQFLRDR
jgi:DNA-binding GntR family transcriptional regulator